MIPKIKLSNTKEEIPIFCLGTWDIRNKNNMIKTIRYAIEIGLNHIDTAEMYGIAEEVIGEAIRGIDRKRIFITSKVLPQNASFNGTILACERSLKKLKTDYIDLYLLHWYEPWLNLSETFSAFSKLIEMGKIRYAGVSNFKIPELQEMIEIFKPLKIVNNQVKYNLDNFRYVEEELLPFCEENYITISGYSPLWQGREPKGTEKWKILEEIAKKYNAKPFQIVLNFLLRKGKIFLIFKTENTLHLEENVNSINLKVEKEDLEKIEKVFSQNYND
ncbi:MAG: aldo/keto reductase [candidate division WOR-3 bacterium]